MIDIDYKFYCQIRNFLDSQTDNYKLRDLRNLVYCKKYRIALINDISKKASELGKEFAKNNIEYLSGQKEYDDYFAFNANNYLKSLDLSPALKQLDERLDKVIEANTYYPVDKNITNKIEKFLEKHDDPYCYLNDKDLEMLDILLGELEKAIFNPRRLIDPNYDDIIEGFCGDLFKITWYHHECIFNIIGNDEDAERLYRRLKTLKDFLTNSKK